MEAWPLALATESASSAPSPLALLPPPPHLRAHVLACSQLIQSLSLLDCCPGLWGRQGSEEVAQEK